MTHSYRIAQYVASRTPFTKRYSDAATNNQLEITIQPKKPLVSNPTNCHRTRKAPNAHIAYRFGLQRFVLQLVPAILRHKNLTRLCKIAQSRTQIHHRPKQIAMLFKRLPRSHPNPNTQTLISLIHSNGRNSVTNLNRSPHRLILNIKRRHQIHTDGQKQIAAGIV